MKSEAMRATLRVTKALSDLQRVRILMMLGPGELCVCQITELFGLAVSTVSKHLSILYQAGLVESRKNGRWIYYRLPGKEAAAAAREAIDWVQKSLGGTPQAVEDNKKLKQILKVDPTTICQRQLRR